MTTRGSKNPQLNRSKKVFDEWVKPSVTKFVILICQSFPDLGSNRYSFKEKGD